MGSDLPRGPERIASMSARCGGLSCSSLNIATRGAGKSAVGEALAKKLGVAFVELDQQIEEASGLPLSEVFARQADVDGLS